MVWKQLDLIRGADKLVRECAGVQPNEDVLVVTDTSTVNIGVAIASSASIIANDVVVGIMKRNMRRTHGQDPPKPIVAAMKACDVVFAPTEWSLYHAPARKDASKAGVRVLSMGTADEEMLVTIANTPFLQMKPIVDRVTELLQKARYAHMTTPGGTDITFDLRGRSKYVDPNYGICHRGDVIKAQSPPVIEANISPVEDTTEGVFVVDACQSVIGLVRNPIILQRLWTKPEFSYREIY